MRIVQSSSGVERAEDDDAYRLWLRVSDDDGNSIAVVQVDVGGVDVVVQLGPKSGASFSTLEAARGSFPEEPRAPASSFLRGRVRRRRCPRGDDRGVSTVPAVS
jgi:hypothetical protein